MPHATLLALLNLSQTSPHRDAISQGGGYLDVGEAKGMIRGLLDEAYQAEREGNVKLREARQVRARASKLGFAVMSGGGEEEEAQSQTV